MIERNAITDQFIHAICERLVENKRVRRTLPIWGRVHIDRQLPFLCVYRRPLVRIDAGTDRVVTSEASYLFASGVRRLHAGLAELVRAIAQILVDRFGAFLILEIWAGETTGDDELASPEVSKPRFRILVPPRQDPGSCIGTFHRALARIKTGRQPAEVEVVRAGRWWPRSFSPILPASVAGQLECSLLGLEVRPVYRDAARGEAYPLILREFRRGLTRALRQAFYEFMRTRTTHRPPHFHTLGRRTVVKAVWEVDQRMAEVSDSFDFLLQVTPVNAHQAWREFQETRFERAPVFHYRPSLADPTILKRRLYDVPIERIEDPTLAELFRGKQDELDRRLTMLLDIDSKRFVHGSLQLFGGVDGEMKQLAEQLLNRFPSRTSQDSRSGQLDAMSFAKLAQKEIEYYRQHRPEVDARVHVRDDIAVGLLVSHGSLLIDKDARVPLARAEALLQHEIGTHVLTYHNGRAQPFRQLYSGLAGYEALQEGLAVLAEYLVGGLNRPRVRMLAARLVAARDMIDGASFVEAFRELHRAYNFKRRTAFDVTMRIYRGGGLTKDVVYLRGLSRLLQYLGEGGELEPLLVGKIALDHTAIMRELHLREVLCPPPLRPRYLDDPQVAGKLAKVRQGLTVLQLIERKNECASDS